MEKRRKKGKIENIWYFLALFLVNCKQISRAITVYIAAPTSMFTTSVLVRFEVELFLQTDEQGGQKQKGKTDIFQTVITHDASSRGIIVLFFFCTRGDRRNGQKSKLFAIS